MISVNRLKGFFGEKDRNCRVLRTGERLSPRYDIFMYARMQGGGAFIERRANIGIGGFCFEGEKGFLPDAVVELLFRLPDTSEWIHAKGRVLGHTQAQGWLGVRGHFTEISFENERRLARWLDETTLQLPKIRRTA